MNRLFITVLLIIFIALPSFGQIDNLRGLVNNYVETGSYDEKIESSIPMGVIDPVNGVFNTSGFSARFPSLKIPQETFTLQLPDLSGYADTIFLVWFLKDMAYLKTGYTNVIILGVTDQGEIDFFIDNNNNRQFESNETTFTFKKWEKQKSISMDLAGKNEFVLANPFYVEEEKASNTNANIMAWEKLRGKIIPFLYTGFSFGNGSASISYIPVDDKIDKVEYFGGIFASTRFTLGLGLEWRNINLMGWGAYEVLYYDENHRYEYIDGEKKVIYNTGVWMKNKLYAGVELDYSLRITRAFSIGPGIAYSYWKALGNKPIDPSLNYDESAVYHNTHALEYMVKMKFIASPRSKFELRLFSSDTSLDAREFFPDYRSDYSSFYKQIYFGAGYIYKFR